MSRKWMLGTLTAVVLGGFLVMSEPASADRRGEGNWISRTETADQYKARKAREAAAARYVAPTFTFRQPVYGAGYFTPDHYGPIYNTPARLVFVPGHWEVMYGRPVWVPPHYRRVYW